MEPIPLPPEGGWGARPVAPDRAFAPNPRLAFGRAGERKAYGQTATSSSAKPTTAINAGTTTSHLGSASRFQW